MSFRIVPITEAPPLSKQPRVENDGHLKFIRTLPCIACGTNRNVEAAHIRMASRIHGKPYTAFNRKSSDMWTVPLCDICHRTGPSSQHNTSEEKFWTEHRIEPCGLALSLFNCNRNQDVAETIIQETRAKASRQSD